jgi:hypothetical protein
MDNLLAELQHVASSFYVAFRPLQIILQKYQSYVTFPSIPTHYSQILV